MIVHLAIDGCGRTRNLLWQYKNRGQIREDLAARSITTMAL